MTNESEFETLLYRLEQVLPGLRFNGTIPGQFKSAIHAAREELRLR